MAIIQAIQRLKLAAGTRVRLTPEQFEPRKHGLIYLGDGVFTGAAPLEFKPDEIIEIVGDVPKYLSADVWQVYVAPAADEISDEAGD